jgi:beta-glucanase (GH16 family)
MTLVYPPSYSGYTLLWGDSFAGSAGTLPNSNTWNIMTGNLGVNGELETYTSLNTNVQLSGGNTLQLIPWTDSSVPGGWTSGRVESKNIISPSMGAITFAEASIRFGSNSVSGKQGIWPAFWMLGRSFRSGTSWPECGELDILETINGDLTGYGTAHCGSITGGICNDPNELGGSITISDQSWHTWRITWDRTPSTWELETITWYMDNQQFHQITGSQIHDLNTWATLCHNPLYFILDVAIGGGCVRPRHFMHIFFSDIWSMLITILFF